MNGFKMHHTSGESSSIRFTHGLNVPNRHILILLVVHHIKLNSPLLHPIEKLTSQRTMEDYKGKSTEQCILVPFSCIYLHESSVCCFFTKQVTAQFRLPQFKTLYKASLSHNDTAPSPPIWHLNRLIKKL